MNILLIELAAVFSIFIVLRIIRPRIRFFRWGYSVRRDSYMDSGARISIEDVRHLSGGEKDFRCMRIGNGNLCYSRIPLDKSSNVLMIYSYLEAFLGMLANAGVSIRRTLTLGGGGGSIPLYTLRRFEDSTADVVEINADSVKMMNEYFLTDFVAGGSPRANLILSDAKEAVKTLEGQYQFIFCDLYIGSQPADVTYDIEFMKRLSALAHDDGMLVVQGGCMNMNAVRVVTMNLLQTFQHVWSMYLGREGFVMAASNRTIPAMDVMMINHDEVIPIYPSAMGEELTQSA